MYGSGIAVKNGQAFSYIIRSGYTGAWFDFYKPVQAGAIYLRRFYGLPICPYNLQYE